jgi:hypothetical protein
MNIETILISDNKTIKEHTDIQSMLNYLKRHYKLTSFQLSKPNVIYKVQKGSAVTISNEKMTDELAIEFLKINPERISLFSVYPDNYKELIGLEQPEGEPEPETSKAVKSSPVKKTTTRKKPCTNCKKKKTVISKKNKTNDK